MATTAKDFVREIVRQEDTLKEALVDAIQQFEDRTGTRVSSMLCVTRDKSGDVEKIVFDVTFR